MLGLGILVGAFALNFSACKSEEQKRAELKNQRKRNGKEVKRRTR